MLTGPKNNQQELKVSLGDTKHALKFLGYDNMADFIYWSTGKEEALLKTLQLAFRDYRIELTK